MPITLTYDHATRLLRQVVGAKPRGYRNDDSRYYQDDPDQPGHGCPMCLIGHLFHLLGVDHPQFLNTCATNAITNVRKPVRLSWNGQTITTLIKDIRLIDCDPRTRKLLRIAQRLQDENHTWRRALGVALYRTRHTEGGETLVTGWNPQCQHCGQTWDDQYDIPPDDPGRYGWDISEDGTATCGDCTLLDHTRTA